MSAHRLMPRSSLLCLAALSLTLPPANGDAPVARAVAHPEGQCVANEEAKILADDGERYDWFGHSVAISGDVLVVGAYGDDDHGSQSGAAYVFRYDGSGWVQEAKLLASDGTLVDAFGWSIAVSGDTVVVGAYLEDPCPGDPLCDGVGSAYVFRYDGSSWVEQAKLVASDGADGDWFGYSVAISGDPPRRTVIVVAPHDDDNGSNTGSAYVFQYEESSWVQKAKLLPSDGEEGDQFGESVAISGDTVLIGAWGDDDNGDQSGSAYVFEKPPSGWADMTETVKLLASDGDWYHEFGKSVAISGDTIVIGAMGYGDPSSYSAGAAYVFRYDGSSWVEETRLQGACPGWGYGFGRRVAVSGNTAVIAGGHASGLSVGSVFQYDGAGWVEETRLLTSDSRKFGGAVAISGGTIVLGDRWDNVRGQECGSAYVFDAAISLSGALGDFYCDGDVDLDDFGIFASCYGGAANLQSSACAPGVCADLDGDGDVDLDDFSIFAANYTGAQ